MKLLAEPWDCGGLYQVGSFPNWDVWGEWNGRFRDDVRRFIKGDPGCKPAFATRIAGSADLYHKNKRCAVVSSIAGSANLPTVTSVCCICFAWCRSYSLCRHAQPGLC